MVIAAFVALVVVAAWRLIASWRYFDRFLWDDGWYLQVARQVAAGELLYRDVAWDYGPLPVYVLGRLFRLSPAVTWSNLLDALLVAIALAAVYLAGRSVLSRWASLAVTAWAGLLGGPVGLISHQLDAYTSPVAWGTGTSLAATAAACAWVQMRSGVALAVAAIFAACAVLSKPEYGLAGLGALAAAVWLVRPPKRLLLMACGCAVLLVSYALLRIEAETLAAAWRGYTGYDLIAVGSVPVLDLRRLLGGLAMAAVAGGALWWLSRLRSMLVLTVLLASLLVVLRVAAGERYLHALGILCRMAWVGMVPVVLFCAWLARRARVPAAFWVLCAYSIAVSLRWFLLGTECPAAAGTTALALCLLVRHEVVSYPTRTGRVVLAVFLLCSSAEPGLDALRLPAPLQPVATALGTVRLPDREVRNIRLVQAALAAAPAGGMFVAGGGPGWYLVSDRPNPTCFDAVWYGLGTTEPEAGRILDDLRTSPPAVVLVERDFRLPESMALSKIWNAVGQPESSPLTTPDGRWTLWIVQPP